MSVMKVTHNLRKTYFVLYIFMEINLMVEYSKMTESVAERMKTKLHPKYLVICFVQMELVRPYQF
jgi:hypothetical protein